jgi:hypothetical protein
MIEKKIIKKSDELKSAEKDTRPCKPNHDDYMGRTSGSEQIPSKPVNNNKKK